MTIRFLLFHGNWENEGRFCALETEKSIIILAGGQDYLLSDDSPEQQLGRNYLKENKNKIKAIVVVNTSWQNIGLLANISQDLGSQIPFYLSNYNQLILNYLFPTLVNKMIVVEENKELKLEEFSLFFFSLNSYLVGNLGLIINYYQYSFYFLTDFIFSNLLDNNLLFNPRFLTNFRYLLHQRRRNVYLITSCQNMHWRNNNSLFFATKNFSSKNQKFFFLLYEFDWLHIFELLEIARKQGRKVQILNEDFYLLINQVLAKSLLTEVIKKEEKNDKESSSDFYLLVGNPSNIESKLSHYLSQFSPEQKSTFHFIAGIPPVVGGEEKLARLLDYLYTISEEITNFSKSEYLSLGISFYDLKLLLQLLCPYGIIILQNSYKNEKFLSHLKGKFLSLNNGYYWDFSRGRTAPIRAKNSLINLEEILIKQRESLEDDGLLIILLITEWRDNKLQLKSVRIKSLAISSTLNIAKLESKIKGWWDNKLTSYIKKDDPPKIIKKAIERRLNGLVNSYLSLEYEIELEETPILLFIQ